MILDALSFVIVSGIPKHIALAIVIMNEICLYISYQLPALHSHVIIKILPAGHML